MKRQYTTAYVCRRAVLALAMVLAPTLAYAQSDPGPRGGAAGAGGRIAGLTLKEVKFFDSGLDSFTEIASVTGSVPGTEPGLGPRFNMTGCATCHAHPAVGGSSPPMNPQVDPSVNPASQSEIDLVTGLGILSPFGTPGPVREVRFSTNGGVHDLFTIKGAPGAPAACNSLTQPAFAAARGPVFPGDLRFRIPTPTFGLGLIEAIEDATILANEGVAKLFGILGTANRNGNDGTVTRFGWKAQNKSLVIFSGEAYNVEQGITNELFPDERGENGTPDAELCRRVVTAPQDTVNFELTQPQKVIDDVNNFADFMRFLAPPVQVSSYLGASAQDITDGEALFNSTGCVVCHIKSMTTGNHANAALRLKVANLFSDLLVHDIGTGDGISQGVADGTQFRTAPLWGAGQRLFFLHDGTATTLDQAVSAHGGEAAPVTANFNLLSPTDKQKLFKFVRSL
jgi:CxxC motif-containing protein (DUF1111 family)